MPASSTVSTQHSTASPARWVAAALAVAGAAVCAALVLMAGAHGREGRIERSVENGGDWYARSPGWFTSRGLYPTEHAPDGAPFAWAAGRLRLQIPQLDRRRACELRLRVRSGRASTDPPALLRVTADGADVSAVSIGSEWQEIVVPLGIVPRTGAVVLIDAQGTFNPGPQDPRALGFMIDRLTLAPIDGRPVTIPAAAFARAGMLAAAVALAAVVCSLPAWLSFASGAAAGAVVARLLLFDSAFLGEYSSALPSLAAGIVILALLASGLSRWVPAGMAGAWRQVALLAIVATALRLAVFLHPASAISDGMFHVHRAQAVRAGAYVFTSVTPRPFYEFPYPIGLYVAAQPFWDLFADRVFLLRAVALAADALVALGLFAVALARREAPSTGTLTAMFALAAPVVIQGVSTANLTNVFAQSCFSLAIIWVGWHLASKRVAVAAAGTVLLLSAAVLSHFSTAVIAVPAAAAIVVAVLLAGDPLESRAWRWIGVACLVALGLSYVVYYSQFHEVYLRTLSRVGTEGAANSFVATLAEHSDSKAVTLLRFLAANYGWAALALASIGAVAAVRRGRRDGWTLVLLALSLVLAAFVLLGAFTPIEMRASLAAHPVVAYLAAIGVTWMWGSRNVVLRAAAVAGTAATVWLGVNALRAVLGGN
jgi:hypothetical protein